MRAMALEIVTVGGQGAFFAARTPCLADFASQPDDVQMSGKVIRRGDDGFQFHMRTLCAGVGVDQSQPPGDAMKYAYPQGKPVC